MVTELGGKHTGDHAEDQTNQSIWGQRGERHHVGSQSGAELTVLSQGRHNAVHDGEHAGHGEQCGEQQAPGARLLKIVGGDHRCGIAVLDLPEDHEGNRSRYHLDSDEHPIRVAEFLYFIDGQIGCQEGDAKNDCTGPIHLRGLFGRAFIGEHRHQHDCDHGDTDHHPEHGTEAERAGKPAAEDGVNTANTAVHRGKNRHQSRIFGVLSHLGVQHDERHRHHRSAYALHHATDHQHGHIHGQRRDHTADGGDAQHAQQYFLAACEIAQSRQEQ